MENSATIPRRRYDDGLLHERIAVLETNYGSMNKSMDSLTGSIENLNEKLEVIGSKFSTAAGVFIAIVFLCQAIAIPIIITIVTK